MVVSISCAGKPKFPAQIFSCMAPLTINTNSFCYRPDFDSPSVFARLQDAKRGGYYAIMPLNADDYTVKQQYLPSSAILQTRFIAENGAMDLTDFFPRPKNSETLVKCTKTNTRETIVEQEELKRWVTRRVECIRGEMDFGE